NSTIVNNNSGINGPSSNEGYVNATNNWWGSVSGPAQYGSGNAVYGSVQIDPWIGKAYHQALQLGQGGPLTRYQAFEGDPVNTANGNHAYAYTDLSIPTRGLPLSFTRSYNSLLPADGLLGWGWRHTWQV